ncbi:MAG: glycosyltransferase [Bryobacteraceae bacterium]|nr:glycosyltransferase [Bryobacteraceae bacterium]
MRILLTNLTLGTRTGTEVTTRDVALGLQALGHELVVYTPSAGPIGDEIRNSGITLMNDLDSLSHPPDIIHGQHHVETTKALLRFPSAPAIFVCHDRLAWHDNPPKSSQIRRYVAVDRNCFERLVYDYGIKPENIRIIHNAVDMRRFSSRDSLPDKPARALLFSNYAIPGSHLEPVTTACGLLNIALDVAGAGTQTSVDAPELVLPLYDLVFAKARCALEAMAVGAAVVLCDSKGLGPMVRMAEVAALRDWNFGFRCLQKRILPGSIVSEVLRYDALDAAQVSSWIRKSATLEAALAQYLELYAEAIEDSQKKPVRTTVDDVLKGLAMQTGGLEATLRSCGVLSLPPLPHTVGQQVTVRCGEQIRSMNAGAGIQVLTEIENRSKETLASAGAYPIHLSYHWMEPLSGKAIVYDGTRTSLTAQVRPGEVHKQLQTIHAPKQAGRFILRLTMLQEYVGWFDSVSVSNWADMVVDVTEPTSDATRVTAPEKFDLERATQIVSGLTLLRNGVFTNLGFVSSHRTEMLTFVELKRFAIEVGRAAGISCVIAKPELASMIPSGVGVAVCERPREAFMRIHNYLANSTEFYWENFASVVDPSARVRSGTQVPEYNVVIGAEAVIESNVTIGERTIIGERCLVQSGAVLGAEGFQTDRSGPHLIDMVHAGGVRLEADSRVLSNATVARGVFREFTIIGKEARIGNGAFVSHNVQVGSRAFIGHGAVVNGNCEIGADAWVGPNATIANGVSVGTGAHVSLGSAVIRDVENLGRVIGSVAVDSRKMMRLIGGIERGNKD